MYKIDKVVNTSFHKVNNQTPGPGGSGPAEWLRAIRAGDPQGWRDEILGEEGRVFDTLPRCARNRKRYYGASFRKEYRTSRFKGQVILLVEARILQI